LVVAVLGEDAIRADCSETTSCERGCHEPKFYWPGRNADPARALHAADTERGFEVLPGRVSVHT
jgi:hypothetical protein